MVPNNRTQGGSDRLGEFDVAVEFVLGHGNRVDAVFIWRKVALLDRLAQGIVKYDCPEVVHDRVRTLRVPLPGWRGAKSETVSGPNAEDPAVSWRAHAMDFIDDCNDTVRLSQIEQGHFEFFAACRGHGCDYESRPF